MRITVLSVAALAVLAALTAPMAAAGSASLAAASPNGDDESTALQETNETDGTNASETTCDYESLYDRAIPAIVQVQLQPTGESPQSGGLGSGFVYATDSGENASELEDTNETTEEDETVEGNETDGDGENATSYVVTNNHVVQDRETVTVEFMEGDSREAEVVGTDLYSDLAVVAVADAPEYVEALSIAASEPEPGQSVAALGSPFGLEGTITEGIVSAVDRSIPAQQTQQGQQMQTGFRIPNTVQTDAPINPGNSGGPLVDCDGDVVGVNSAGMGQNLGFAIGTSMVERVVPALIEDGEYEHSYLGVATTEVSAQIAEANDLESTHGVYVHRVSPDGPAADALQGTADESQTVDDVPVPVGGDVIVEIDGEEIRNAEQLSSYLALETSPGDEIELTVLRDGAEETVTVTLEERPEPGETGP